MEAQTSFIALQNPQQLSLGQQNIQIDIMEGKKESIESAKFSAETALKDSKIKENIGRVLGGLLGIFLLFGSITNVVKDFKSKKRSPWVYRG